jgi:hypothetical protein
MIERRVRTHREYLEAIRLRVIDLKAADRSEDDAAEQAALEIQARFTGWSGSLVNAARIAYREAD